MRVLFLCSQNRLRSPTAEAVFSNWRGVECESAGVHASETTPVGPELLAWAELIFVMEKTQRHKLARRWRKCLSHQRVVCLDIPDEYDFMDPALIRLLEAKVAPHLIEKGCSPPES